MDWTPIEFFIPLEGRFFLGVAVAEDPAVFYSTLVRSKWCYYIRADSEGLNNYAPTHFRHIPKFEPQP